MTLVRRFLLCIICGLFGLGLPAPARAQSAAPSGPPTNVEADPIRCWWRTSAGAVRTGETFSVVLTCAVLDTEAVQIITDEAPLGVSVIQMAPFETVTGSHPADLRTASRRFFQYAYTLRIINQDFIGKDVRMPDLVLHYRVNSRLAGNTSVQGRDLLYVLPPLQVRVLSMVAADAFDVRDSSNETFSAIEALEFRANILRIVAVTLLALGALIGLLSIARLFGRVRHRAPVGAHVLSARAVLSTAADELASVQRESEQGWTDALSGRALAASRIVAACVMDHPVSQRIADRDDQAVEGRLTRRSRSGTTTAVWSTLTAEALTDRLARRTRPVTAEQRQLLDGLRTSLATLTAVQYAATPVLDRASLDAALSTSVEAVQTLKSEHAWLKTLLRRSFGRDAAPERHP